MTQKQHKIILGHDYLIQMGGAEKVVASMHRAWPEAPIYVSATDYAKLLPDFRTATIHNTWMQKIPGINSQFKKLFPVYPFAFKSLGALDADAAVVSSSGFAKWLKFTPRTQTFCYCHTPPRFFWQTDHYLKNEVSSGLVKAMAKVFIPPLRRSDYKAAQQVTHFIANSECVQARIKEFYGRDSVVIYPAVEVHKFDMQTENDGFYLILSRLVSYKGIDRAVAAFAKSGKRLVIAGSGPDRDRLEKLAAGARNIEFKGRVEDAEVKRLIERCYAFVFPGLEDFGITPVEAQAAGKPVLAYGDGGALETVIPGETGLFFKDPEPDAINAVVSEFEKIAWNPARIRANAERFAEEKFISAMKSLVETKLAEKAAR
jgi:glycosyltransferase involved in cell wall biosynthesis